MVQKADIELPEGMTAEQLQKLVSSFTERRVKNQARNKAKREAVKKLIDNHKAEYDKLLAAEMPQS